MPCSCKINSKLDMDRELQGVGIIVKNRVILEKVD
jgi:hypothetical protein